MRPKRPPVFRDKPDRAATYRPKVEPPDDAGRIARHRFYNRAAWRKCRALKLRRNPLCERCESEGRTREASQVHHKTDLADAPELAYVLTNLESLCQECHSRETMMRIRSSYGGSRPKTRPPEA